FLAIAGQAQREREHGPLETTVELLERAGLAAARTGDEAVGNVDGEGGRGAHGEQDAPWAERVAADGADSGFLARSWAAASRCAIASCPVSPDGPRAARRHRATAGIRTGPSRS